MNEDNEKQVCSKCGGRLALVTGTFFYSPHAEPYESGILEKSILRKVKFGSVLLSVINAGISKTFL